MSIISLKEVSKLYHTKEVETIALENVNLSIEQGEFVSIMGPSGCGKSTLLNIIGLLDKASSGSLELLGRDMTRIADSEAAHFRNANLGFVFQSFHLIPSLNVAANVELPLIYRKGVSASERRRKVEEVLERLGMSHRIRHLPTQLSGGQCQRVAIARAIVGGPQIVLADEPTGNLDPETGRQIINSLYDIAASGTAVVVATHNLSMLDRFPGRVLRCADKQLIDEGTPTIETLSEEFVIDE